MILGLIRELDDIRRELWCRARQGHRTIGIDRSVYHASVTINAVRRDKVAIHEEELVQRPRIQTFDRGGHVPWKAMVDA